MNKEERKPISDQYYKEVTPDEWADRLDTFYVKGKSGMKFFMPCSPPDEGKLAIEFADWIQDNQWNRSCGLWYKLDAMTSTAKTTSELLSIFKQQTGRG